MTDGWFPPRDIFNQGNENLGEVLEGVVSGLVSGSQRKLHAIPKDEDTQAGGDTYLTQDQQNPERESYRQILTALGPFDSTQYLIILF